MRNIASFVALAALAAAPLSSAYADEPGYILLQRFDDIGDRNGAQEADLFVYNDDGSPHSGASGGQFDAGSYVEVQPGWYFVEVGRFRAPASAYKVHVVSDEVTVVPSGWVSVSTPPPDAQPLTGCAQWNAELNAFVAAADGSTTLVNSNRGSGVRTWGAIQLMAGEHEVYFNDVPTLVSIVDGELHELPTGYQDPVYGERPQLSTAPDGDPSGLRLPLCSDGPLQVPAGTYWASGAVAIDVYPYERREWNQVTVAPDDDLDERRLRADRLRYTRYDGPGSTPTPLTDEERSRISGTSDSGSIRLTGFGN